MKRVWEELKYHTGKSFLLNIIMGFLLYMVRESGDRK
jgi:hypothetical protein